MRRRYLFLPAPHPVELTQDGIPSDTDGNCDTNANFNSGCTFLDPRETSNGASLAANGGGVFAGELTSDGVSIWFFPRPSVPSDLSYTASSSDNPIPDPSTWGLPVAHYPTSSCNVSEHFAPQHIVMTITACGDWAGQVTNSTGCPLTTESCCESPAFAFLLGNCRCSRRLRALSFANVGLVIALFADTSFVLE